MGNTQKKSKTPLLFELPSNLAPPFQSRKSPLSASSNPPPPLPAKESPDFNNEFIKTQNFSTKLCEFSSLYQPNNEFTDLYGVNLDYGVFFREQFPVKQQIRSLLNHVQIIAVHSKIEYLEDLGRSEGGKIDALMMDMSPIRRQDSLENMEFETPSPIKSEFRKEKSYAMGKNFTKTPEKPKENTDFLVKNVAQPKLYRPNFIHFSQVLTGKDYNDNLEEERLERSLQKIDKKIKEKKAYFYNSKEKVNNAPLYLLDLWKTVDKSSYKELSLSRNKSLIKREPLHCEITENPEKLDYDLQSNYLKSNKKHSKINDVTKDSAYSKPNLEKYLNKKHSNFSANWKFLKKKKEFSEKGHFAENRGNFLYMNYDYPKSNCMDFLYREKENLENSMFHLKKSLNYTQNSQKIIKKSANLTEKNEDFEQKTSVSDIELLKNSIMLSKNPRFFQTDKNSKLNF